MAPHFVNENLADCQMNTSIYAAPVLPSTHKNTCIDNYNNYNNVPSILIINLSLNKIIKPAQICEPKLSFVAKPTLT